MYWSNHILKYFIILNGCSLLVWSFNLYTAFYGRQVWWVYFVCIGSRKEICLQVCVRFTDAAWLFGRGIARTGRRVHDAVKDANHSQNRIDLIASNGSGHRRTSNDVPICYIFFHNLIIRRKLLPVYVFSVDPGTRVDYVILRAFYTLVGSDAHAARDCDCWLHFAYFCGVSCSV